MNVMKKNQKKHAILFALILISLTISSHNTMCQEITKKLFQADSLFQEKKYTESFEIYTEILESDEKTSAQMLLKMAFIKEGLGDHSQALVFLNKYYDLTSDERARDKMQELAETNELSGYSNEDSDFIVGFINQNAVIIYTLVFSVVALLLFIVVYRKLTQKSDPIRYAIILILLLVSFWFVINFNLASTKGVIIDNHAYLMTAPSSGADLVDVIKKGHRVEILDQNEIWTKVSWLEQEVYIKNEKIKLI